MNGLQAVLTHPATARLGWALLHFLWQGAAIAVVLGIGLIALCRARANTRYVVACITLCLMVAAPIITYSHLTPSAIAPLPSFTEPIELPEFEPSEGVAVAAAPVEMSFTPVIAEPVPIAPPPAPQPWHVRAMDWIEAHLNWFVGVWFCGVIMLSIRLLMGWIGVRRMRRSGAAPSRILQERLSRLAQKLRVTRTVRLLESAAARTPVVMGWLRPAILFPASLLTQLSAEQLDAVLAHELAHIRRHDYLVNLFQAVVETLLFYHPAVHWVSHRIRVEREHACDDLAVSACGDSTSYAHALARLAEMNAAGPRLLPGASGHLFTRIKRLLHMDTPRHSRAPMWIGGVLLLLALLGCAMALGRSKASAEETGDPKDESRESEAPPDYSAMFEMIEDKEGYRLATPEEAGKLGYVWPTVPLEENAAYWFAKAARQLTESQKESPVPPGSNGTPVPYAGDAAGFVRYVERNKDVLTTFMNGMSPGRVFSLPPTIFTKSGVPGPGRLLSNIRKLSWFIADAGFAAELQGTPNAAAEKYLICIRMGKMISPNLELITYVSGIGTQDLGAKRLDALMANSSLDAETLRMIIRTARDAEASVEDRLAMWRRDAEFTKVVIAKDPRSADTRGKNYDAYAKFVGEELSKPLPELLRSSEEALKKIEARYPNQVPLAQGLFRTFPQFCARSTLRLRVIQIRAAIALYQMKHGGEPPQKLEELTPEYLPKESLIDPFSGSNLKYLGTLSQPEAWRWPTAADMGWKLWSVGDNLKDDGGAGADVDQDNWKGPDYIFTNEVRSNIDRRSGGKIKTISGTPRSKEEYHQFLGQAIRDALPEGVTASKFRFAEAPFESINAGSPDRVSGPQPAPERIAEQQKVDSAKLRVSFEPECAASLGVPTLVERVPHALQQIRTGAQYAPLVTGVYVGEIEVLSSEADTLFFRTQAWIGFPSFDEFEASVERSGTTKPPFAPTTDKPLSFGPVIERVVFEEDPENRSLNTFVDLDTGKLFNTEDPDSHSQSIGGIEDVLNWMWPRGIDVSYADAYSEKPSLGCLGMIVLPVPNESWEVSDAGAAAMALAKSKPLLYEEIKGNKDEPATFLFKTREGGMGVLQILGTTDDPKGVRIRYKRVQQAKDKAKSGDFITRDIMFSSEERTETGAICKWEVPAGAPVRLLTASITLEDGQMRETTGPGGRQTADQFYRMGVEWEWSTDGDMLVISRGVVRYEDDGTMSSRGATKRAIPANATFKTKHLAEPAILSGEPTILWRGDWIRDGRIVKSVIFVAYAVGDGVSPDLTAAAEAAAEGIANE